MKEQTYLTEVRDDSGKMLDFERWGYKKLTTVLRTLNELYFGDWSSIYANLIQPENKIIVYKTISEPYQNIRIAELTIEGLKEFA